MTRPRGMPPIPRAMSRERQPVEITATSSFSSAPSRMMEPLPYCFSIWLNAWSRALVLSAKVMSLIYIPFPLKLD